MSDNLVHVDHPEDERFDAIDICTVERWKESELSGDEWRFSYIAEVKRKGQIIITIKASRLEWLLQGLQWNILIAGENNDVDLVKLERTKDKCDQPGCSEIATIFYKRLKPYTKQGEELVMNERFNEYRQFCDRHKRRGDCDLDDADHNYLIIEKP